MNPITSFLRGFFIPLQALKFIFKKPSLAFLAAIPFFLNLTIYTVFVWYVQSQLGMLIQEILYRFPPWVPAWAAVLTQWIVKILVWLLLLLLSTFTFTLVGGILASPFNDMLTTKTLRLLGSNNKIAELGVGQVVGLELKRSLVLFFVGVVAIFLGVVPFMQVPAFLLAAWIVAFEYFGYPVSKKSNSLSAIKLFMVKRPFLSLGFGSALVVMMALPLLGMVYIPLAVVGATLLYSQETDRDLN